MTRVQLRHLQVLVPSAAAAIAAARDSVRSQESVGLDELCIAQRSPLLTPRDRGLLDTIVARLTNAVTGTTLAQAPASPTLLHAAVQIQALATSKIAAPMLSAVPRHHVQAPTFLNSFTANAPRVLGAVPLGDDRVFVSQVDDTKAFITIYSKDGNRTNGVWSSYTARATPFALYPLDNGAVLARCGQILSLYDADGTRQPAPFRFAHHEAGPLLVQSQDDRVLISGTDEAREGKVLHDVQGKAAIFRLDGSFVSEAAPLQTQAGSVRLPGGCLLAKKGTEGIISNAQGETLLAFDARGSDTFAASAVGLLVGTNTATGEINVWRFDAST